MLPVVPYYTNFVRNLFAKYVSGSRGLYFRSVEATQRDNNVGNDLQASRKNVNSGSNKLVRNSSGKIRGWIENLCDDNSHKSTIQGMGGIYRA